MVPGVPGGMWVRVCCSLSTFNVTLGTTVQVDVEVVTKPGG